MRAKNWKHVATALTIAFALTLGTVAVVTAQVRSGYARFDTSAVPTDQAQCGVAKTTANPATAGAPWEMYIAVTNTGSAGLVRVEYKDGDSIDYFIAANGVLNLRIAGGQSFGTDDIVTVKEGPTTPGVILQGIVSATTDRGKPHANLTGQTASPTLLCTAS